MSVTQFNNTTTKDGLIQKCEQTLFGDNGFGKISGNTNLLYMFANFANEALSWYSDIAIKYSKNWRFDPSTYTTFPEAYTNLVSGQKDYALDVNFLNITNVEIQDAQGNFLQLKKTSDEEIETYEGSPTEYGTATGTPTHYKYLGNSLILIPTPDFSVTEGLKLTISRDFAYFTYDDTTDTVGIPLGHSRFISDYMSWLYARDRAMTLKVELEKRVLKYEQQDIPSFYSTRADDTKPTLKVLRQNNK